MAGWFLDILVEYLVRVAMRIVQILRSRSWPAVAGTVTGSFYVNADFGCDIAKVCYEYRVDGVNHVGTYKNPVFFKSLGENYIARFPHGTELIIRIKPGKASISIMEEKSSTSAEAANVQSD